MESGWKTCCVLGVGNITGPPRDKVHTSRLRSLVATFPTSLVSSRLELPCKSYCISGFAVLLFCLGRSFRPEGAQGPESPVHRALKPHGGSLCIEAVVGPEFPRSFRTGRSFCPQWPEFPAHLDLLRSEQCGGSPCIEAGLTPEFSDPGQSFRPLGVRSFRPGRSLRPSWTGNSGVSWLQRLFFWEGYKYPSTYLQPASSSKHVFPLSLLHC